MTPLRRKQTFAARAMNGEVLPKDQQIPTHHPVNAIISSRASGRISNRSMAAGSSSKIASDTARTALPAQSPMANKGV